MRVLAAWPLVFGLVSCARGEADPNAAASSATTQRFGSPPTPQGNTEPPTDHRVPTTDDRRPSIGGRASVAAGSSAPSLALLAGQWTGTAVVPTRGTAVANISLDARGAGYYFVSLGGLSLNGPFRVAYWNGRVAHVEAADRRERIGARLSGHALELRLPVIGTVALQRTTIPSR